MVEILQREKRTFLPEDFVIDSWDRLEPFFENLNSRELNSVSELEKWILDRSEMDAVLEEDMAWRYIKMNIDTRDEELSKSFNFFVSEISPKIAPYSNDFNKKLVASPHLEELDAEKYFIYLRGVKSAIELFREENIPIQTELQTMSQKYGVISAKMMVEVDGESLTMQKAATFLKNTDRAKREEVFRLMNFRRAEDSDELNTLYSELIEKRQQVAKNADFENYRDYMFSAMGRFDYTKEDCFNFHESIKDELASITTQFSKERKEKLKLDTLRPWDGDVDLSGQTPLKPFEGSRELIDKSVECLGKVNPYFGECIQIMDKMGHLDLDSKEGKAPGGFNYPLYEVGVPFIYMNSVGTFRDVITMIHEAGHAVHSFLSRDLAVTDFKSTPSEVAELASMSMELITMDYWGVFFPNEADLKRAKKEHMEKILGILPWIAMVDKFQHWVYENPTHSVEQRLAQWTLISDKFSSGITDWSGFDEVRAIAWQKQLHLYEVPFYYIEYGMAQLGAIAVWRNYKESPKQAVDQYMNALKLGYTKSIGEIYESAGVKFDFSAAYVKELAEFVKRELAKL